MRIAPNFTKTDKTVFTVFVVLFLIVSSVAKAVGIRMSFSLSLVGFSFLYIIYFLIKNRSEPKKTSSKNTHLKKSATPLQLLISLLFILAALGFYWFEIRPSKIRQSCSFVTKHTDAKVAFVGKTEAQLLEEGLLRDCTGTGGLYEGFCESANKATIEYWTSRPAETEKDVVVPASKSDYDFCVRSRGLSR